MPAHKLHGRVDFQGLPVSIENRKGSYRTWKDHFNGTEGKTLMRCAYGYVRGTLGTDGDEVDVYLGPDKKSDKVFVITQMKTPKFAEIDEQKCMLGFSSAKEAKAAYLAQYDNPKFFGSMKEMSLEDFKSKLKSKGKLIKCAKLWYNNTSENYMTKLRLDPRSRFQQVEASIVRKSAALDPEDMDLKKKEVKKNFEDFHSAMEHVEKALTARATASLMGTNARVTTHGKLVADMQAAATVAPEPTSLVDYGMPGISAGIAKEQPAIGNNQESNTFEPPRIPVRHVEAPAPEPVAKGLEFASGPCGHIVKGGESCAVCTTLGQGVRPGPYWR